MVIIAITIPPDVSTELKHPLVKYLSTPLKGISAIESLKSQRILSDSWNKSFGSTQHTYHNLPAHCYYHFHIEISAATNQDFYTKIVANY